VRDPDPRTVERARQGDRDAFEELVRTSQADAYRFALYLTRDRALAEDVTQEAFLRAYRFLGGYRGVERFGSWMFSIVRNCANDAMRRERRTVQLTEPDRGAVDVADASIRIELDEALRSISPDHRETFLVVEVFGLTYVEAADVLGVAVGTVKSRMFRARQALCAAISDNEEEAR
jgi:RNA polymerase sigma-70 factor, ECF subfamily